jgi:hypothetical protein
LELAMDNVEDFAEVEARVFEFAVDMLAVGFDEAGVLVNDNLDIVTGPLVASAAPCELRVYVTKIAGQLEADRGGHATDEDALSNKSAALRVGIDPELFGDLVDGCLDVDAVVLSL